jgi:4'-phosphopantetheinyl transferase
VNSSPSLKLLSNEVHVWCASLYQQSQHLAEFLSLLCTDEKSRAERFYFERDRNRFIIGRGILRTILSSYLDTEASRLEFDYNPYGKPALKTLFTDKVLQFNLSHSKDLAIYVFTWNRRVGIDLEYVHAMPDINHFAEQFFSPRESEFIDSLPGKQKLGAFFKIWTCKEAFLKANGSGLITPINQAEVSLMAGGTAHLTAIGDDPQQAACWHLESFAPAIGYQASIAIEGHDWQMKFRQLDDYLIR